MSQARRILGSENAGVIVWSGWAQCPGAVQEKRSNGLAIRPLVW